MNVDSFWELIERSRQATSDPGARLRWLERLLGQLPLAEIVDFQLLLDRTRKAGLPQPYRPVSDR